MSDKILRNGNGYLLQGKVLAEVQDHPPKSHNHDGVYLPITAFSGLTKITVSATEPPSPSVNDLWVDIS